ncbi:MAG: hypothetical protein J6M62_09260 [Selenomonadaceae bacterium]|nr:hypothetical protein [Selenomonadaceae bacterium]
MKTKSLCVLGFFFAVMFVVNSFMPYYRDDYLAGIIWKTPHRLENFGDVLTSLILYYEFHGGRLVSFFLQFVIMLYDKVYFNALNALAFISMMTLIVMHAAREINALKHPKLLFAAGIFMWLGIFDFGEVVVWLCGSVVYLWTGVLAALFLLPYNLALKGKFLKYNPFLSFIMLCLGIVGACSVENLTVTTSLIAFGVCAYLYKKKTLKCHLVFGAIGSLLGTLICIFAPGNFQRIIDDEDRGMIFHILNQIPANLEMLLFMLPVILLMILSYRLLKVDLATEKGLSKENIVSVKKHHFALLTFVGLTLLSYMTNGFFQYSIYNAIVAAVLSPLGLTDYTTISHFHNTMSGVDEALLYILAVSYIYLKGAEVLHITKAEIAFAKSITLKDIINRYVEAKTAAFFVLLSLFNNMVVMGAPSFPGRALFSSSCIFIMGAVALISAKPAYDAIFESVNGKAIRISGIMLVIFLQIASIAVLHSIYLEDKARVAIIAEHIDSHDIVYVPKSKIPLYRKVLRHIAYDDYDTGMTRDHISRYYNVRTIKLLE